MSSCSFQAKVAMEEPKRLDAQLAVIDEDVDVWLNKLSKIFTFELFKSLLVRDGNKLQKLGERNNSFQNHKDFTISRSSVTEFMDNLKKVSPELVEILITERDWIMFTRL